MTAAGEPGDPHGRRGELRSAGGLRLHTRVWALDRPRAALLIAHGLGEHSGRYASLATHLASRGIAVFALDFRGHGLSGGRRGHVPRFDAFVEELGALHGETVASIPPGLPVLLLGHSLGGLVSIRYLESHPEAGLAGAVLSAPALGLRRVSVVQELAARVLSRVLPAVPLPNGIDASDLSRDPAEVAAYRKDPLVHRWITPRLFTEMQRAMETAQAERERVGIPALVLIPGADRVVDPDATATFCRGLPLEVCRLPDSYHEPLHDLGREAVVEEVTRWMEARIA